MNPESSAPSLISRVDSLTDSFEGKSFYFPERADVLSFDSSLQENMFQIVLDGRRYCVDERTLQTLQYFRRGVPANQAFGQDETRKGVPGTPQLINQLFGRGLLRTAQIAEEETIKGRGPRRRVPVGMFLLVPILSERAITWIASVFRVLFKSSVAWVMGVGIVLAHLTFLFHTHASHAGGRLSSRDFVCLVGLVLLSLMFHEIGHATASEHYGVHPVSLGFAVFWIYPVLFTDVTGTWRLQRWERAVVGASGLYFHLIASAIACVTTLLIPSRIPVLLVYSIWLAVFLNANPFLQFDGYWIVTDLLGIPNLRYVTHSAIRRVGARLLRKELPDQSLWRSLQRVKTPVIIYAVAYCGFMIYLANTIARRILPQLLKTAPLLLRLDRHLLESDRFTLESLGILWHTAVTVIMLAGLFRVVHRVLAHLYRAVLAMRAQTERGAI